MTKLPEISDKFRYIGEDGAYFTHGELYIVHYIHADGDISLVDDEGDDHLWSPEHFSKEFEAVKSGPSPDTAALIANLARRVSELEADLDEIKNRDYYEKTVAAYSEMGEDTPTESPKADQIRQACDTVRDLLIRKNHDYGDSFAQQYTKYGLQSALIRMDDKMRRLETLSDGAEAQVAESIEDSLADLAGYALLALVEARAASK